MKQQNGRLFTEKINLGQLHIIVNKMSQCNLILSFCNHLIYNDSTRSIASMSVNEVSLQLALWLETLVVWLMAELAQTLVEENGFRAIGSSSKVLSYEEF